MAAAMAPARAQVGCTGNPARPRPPAGTRRTWAAGATSSLIFKRVKHLGSRLLGWERPATADGTALLVGSVLDSLTLTAMRETRRLDLLVPIRDNNGRPFLEEDFTAVERLLVDVVGGFTRRPDVTGVWRNESGRIFHDASRSYTATVPVARTTEVASLLHRFITDRFRQEAVMLEATPTLSAVF